MSEKTNFARIVAADILSAVEGGILPPGPTLDFQWFSNFSAGSAGLEAPALRQAGKPAATFFRHALMKPVALQRFVPRRLSNFSAGSAGLEAPALRQAGKPAATFFQTRSYETCCPTTVCPETVFQFQCRVRRAGSAGSTAGRMPAATLFRQTLKKRRDLRMEPHKVLAMAIRTTPRPLCPLCGNAGNVLYPDLQDRMFAVPGTWSLKQCNNQNCCFCWLDTHSGCRRPPFTVPSILHPRNF